MAKQLSNTVTETQMGNFQLVSLDDILALPENNSRKFPPDPKKLKVLATDLKGVRGQMFPLLVLERNGASSQEHPQPYELRDGFRRFAAMQLLKEEGHEMKAMVRVFSGMDALEGFKLSMAANNPDLKEEPSLMDQAFQIHEMKSKDMGVAAIGAEMGKSIGWVSTVGKFVELRPEIQKDIHQGKLKWAVARYLPGMDEKKQDEVLGKYFAAVQNGEAVFEIGEDHRDKKKAKGRGKKAKGSGEAGSGKKPPSIKVLARACEEFAVEPQEDPETGKTPRETKAEETFRLIFTHIGQFASGKIGAKSLANKIKALL